MIMTTAETAQDRVIDWWANSSKRPPSVGFNTIFSSAGGLTGQDIGVPFLAFGRMNGVTEQCYSLFVIETS
jgi:hypothetical protein